MKYIPQRRCVACHSSHPKNEMIRLAKLADGSFCFDKTKKLGGRGAYVCNDKNCIANAIKKNAFQRSMKTKVPSQYYEMLTALQEDI